MLIKRLTQIQISYPSNAAFLQATIKTHSVKQEELYSINSLESQ